MANTFLTIDMITLESLAVLENQLTFTPRIRRKYSSEFGVTGAKIGDTVRVRKPARYLGRTGQGYQPEAITETYVNVALNTQFGVDFEMSSADLLLKIDEFSNRILKPAIARIANKVDFDGLSLSDGVAAFVGTPGTTPSSLLTFLQAGVKLDNAAAPNDGDRCIVLNPLMQATIVNALTTIFNPTSEISRQYKKGMMGTAAGFDWYMDQNVNVHTVGNIAGTPLTNGATVSGATSIVTNGWTATVSTMLAGDKFTLAGVNAVNPQNYQSTGELAQFVCAVSQTADAGGNMTIPIVGALISAGPFQNVSALPASGAALLTFGSVNGAANQGSPQGLAFHPDFATLVSADLPLPKGTDMAGRKSDDQLGFSMRFIRDYDPVTDQMVNRFDILYGWAVLRPELACVICG